MPRGYRNAASKNLTKRAVDALKPAEREYIAWDSAIKGFGVRVHPSGRKTYFLKYRTATGENRKPRIGVHGNITADQARTTARQWHADITKGGDPGGARRAARRAVLDPRARFENVVDEFIEKRARPRQRTWKETQRTLKTNCAPWLSRPISTITKADAYDLLDGFLADGHHAKARVTRAWLRDLFRWAAERDIVAASVMEGVDIEVERRVRTRRYNGDEIRAVWKAADTLESAEGAYVKLVALLGVRKGELAGMRRGEFDDPTTPTLWTVPHERTKSRKLSKRKREYIIPLPPLAQRIVKGALRDGEDIVFPGRHEDTTIDPGTWLRAKVRTASGIADWTFHTHRDTVASWLEDRGHSEFERGLVLNHGAFSVTADYSHGYPVELKRALLEKWADHVAGLVQPKGITILS